MMVSKFSRPNEALHPTLYGRALRAWLSELALTPRARATLIGAPPAKGAKNRFAAMGNALDEFT
jgi:hypothetical protein